MDLVNDVDTLLNRLCHLMVAFERAIREAPGDSDRRLGLDMPGLAVLVSLDLFGVANSTVERSPDDGVGYPQREADHGAYCEVQAYVR